MKTITFTWLILGFSVPAFAGGEVGNGGDVLGCEYSINNDYQGFYTLDYFLTQDWQRPGLEILPAEDAGINLHRVAERLARIEPAMGASLKEFLTSYFQPSVLNKRQWLPSADSFADIHDEQLLNIIPINCLRDSSLPRLHQTVVRRMNGARIHYYFYKPMMEELAKYRPIQLSFLLLHEWLWDYLDNAESIRLANFTLHTNWIESAGPDELKKALVLWGLVKADSATPPECAGHLKNR